jgi:hypothetical protein
VSSTTRILLSLNISYCLLGRGVPDERATSIFISSNLKTEEVYSSETSVTTYQAIRRHIKRDTGDPKVGICCLVLFFRGAVKWFWLRTGHNRRDFVNMVMNLSVS